MKQVSNFFKGFALAFSMFTILPFFKVHDFFRGINGYAVLSYPIVGAILGLILYLVHSVLVEVFTPLNSAVITLGLWVLLTGALHLDGLSDTIDALFVKDERKTEVLKDPHVGAMGMTFTVVFLLLKTAALISLENFYLLIFILMLSRAGVMFAIKNFHYIRAEGMSTLAKEEFSFKLFIISVLIVNILLMFEPILYLLEIITILTIYILNYWFKKKFGGWSGDMYGFAIEITELILLESVLILHL